MGRHERLPPRTLPVVYLAFGHLSLALAFLLLALEPELGRFFYQPGLVAAVHLVTLGWLTCSVLGATYVAGPLALRMTMRANWVDGVACGAFLVGVAGVVFHFWAARWAPLEPGGPGTYWGVASSGVLLLLAFLAVAVRTWRGLGRGGAPLAVRVHVGLAYGNLLLAGTWGSLLAVNKVHTILPGNQLAHVVGHAHLAVLGWVLLMFVGVGYRLLPMLLPAGPPSGRVLWLSAALFETGIVGLAVAVALESGWSRLFAVVTAAAVLLFLGLVVRMRLDPRPPPKKLRRPDLGVWHTLQALVYLLVAAGAGLYIAFEPGWQLEWLMVYAVCGLVGFLSQAVVGVGMRLFPMFSWTEAYAGSGHATLPLSPHAMPLRALQVASLAAWTLGVPLLAYGLARTMEPCIAGGAWLLVAGSVAAGVNTAWVVRHAYRRPLNAAVE